MGYEQKDNSGSLFKNEKRESDSHPNLTGTIMVEGKMFWVSAWTKESEKAGKWLSLAVRPKEDKPKAKPARQREPGDDDESIPF